MSYIFRPLKSGKPITYTAPITLVGTVALDMLIIIICINPPKNNRAHIMYRYIDK